MAYTVEAAFNEFYENINLSGDHRETANSRKEHLIGLLQEKFEILEAFGTGSIPRFTALKGHSDVDIMVALHYGKHIKEKTPTQVLQSVRDALAFKTEVRKNGQAVTLYYNSWPNVDIVPVSRSVDSNGNVTHYEVPNSKSESWIESRPRAHTNNVDSKVTECGANFRRIIKMIKWWNLTHSDFLQSYHIEALAVTCMHGNLDETPWNVFHFFSNARPLLEGMLWYEGSFADKYLSYADREQIKQRFDTAIDKARSAWHADYGSHADAEKAITLWRTIFGEKFPAYG